MNKELIFKSAHINETRAITVWEVAKGKSIRLIGYRIHAVGTVAHDRIIVAELIQNGNPMPFRQLLPITNVKDSSSHILPVILLGTGYLLKKDSDLKIRISDSLLHGFVDVLVWGYEE